MMFWCICEISSLHKRNTIAQVNIKRRKFHVGIRRGGFLSHSFGVVLLRCTQGRILALISQRASV